MSPVGRTALRLLRCVRRDAPLFFRSILWRLALPFLKHVVPLPALVRFVSGPERRTIDDGRRRARVAAVNHLLVEGGRLAVSTNCLERSLLVYRFLGEVGARPNLVMGISSSNTGLTGHTWIEVDGQPINDATTSGFAPVIIFGPGGQARAIAR